MHMTWVWRLIAAATLAMYAFLVFAGVRFIATNIVFSLALTLTSIFLIYAGWLVMTATGKRKRNASWLLTIVLATLVAELIFFVRTIEDVWSVLLVAGITLVYVELVGVLREKYWKLQREAANASQKTAHFKNPYLIINPKSGDGRAVKANIQHLAEEKGIQVLILSKGDDVETMARKAVESGADVLGISGGDGSIGAVAKVAIEKDMPIVVLPGGTRCHFARDLGMDPKRIVDALESFNGVKRKIDVGAINGRIFLNNSSFGLYGDMVSRPGYRENKLHVSRQVLQEIASGKKQSYDLQFRYGKQRIESAVQVLVGVNRYQTLNVFELGQRPKLDEGVLQINALTKLNDATVKKLLGTMSIGVVRGQKALPDFIQWVSKSFEITSDAKKLVVGVDGENEEYSCPVRVTIKPKALTIYIPAEGVRPRPKNAFSITMAQNIWHAVSEKY